MLKDQPGLPDEESLVRQIETLVNVSQKPVGGITSNEGHKPWLPAAKTTINWNFWNRYKRFLEQQKLTPRAVTRELDNTTDYVLERLENPSREPSWSRRGLVVGQVQSGKTSNYIGLICKAADAGYKLIVVLTGIHNSLRSQTQLRVDEGFLGIDSQYHQRSDQADSHHIGVGRLRGFDRLYAASLTTSAERGDFNRARALVMPVGAMPVVLVVKKHTGILKNIRSWVTSMHGTMTDSGTPVVTEIPLLIIDDEADYASLDTSVDDPNVDPTETNKNIRLLLKSFDRSAYVGYTATPVGNIFADTGEHSEYGPDIFPDSFISGLDAPSNYLGPERVFGMTDPNTDEATEPLPIYREVGDAGVWMPDKHRATWRPRRELPATLRQAVLSFILCCAIRRSRGQIAVHNSMLIHVTRFQLIQRKVHAQINDLLQELQDRLRYGDGNRPDTIEDQLQQLWLKDHQRTTMWFPNDEYPSDQWDGIRRELNPAVQKIQLRMINGQSKDALEYWEHREDGLSLIAIGGDKLSRGLTLEGLSVSYYLRASNASDTLMQMGRWFGYRPGYEDLCRLYTTAQLHRWYRESTEAALELRAQLDEMEAQDATPREYGLRVQMSPSGLRITAPNKMRRAKSIRLSFSGTEPETNLFDTASATRTTNLGALRRFVRELDGISTKQDGPRGNLMWRGVPGSVVVELFFGTYSGHPDALRSRPQLIAKYVAKCLGVGELTNWTVGLISSGMSGAEQCDIAGHTIGLSVRNSANEGEGGGTSHTIRHILSPSDEWLDLTPEQYASALAETIRQYEADRDRRTNRPTEPSGPAVRRQRPPTDALLLLYVLEAPDKGIPIVGFATSLPHSAQAVSAEYAANEIWVSQQFDTEDQIS